MIASSILKTPIMYIMDELFKISFALPQLENVLWSVYHKNQSYLDRDVYTNSTIGQIENDYSDELTTPNFNDVALSVIKVLMCFLSKSCVLLFFTFIKQGNYEFRRYTVNGMWISFVFCFLAFVLLIFIYLLSTKYMRIMYLHIISICVVIVSFWTNLQTLRTLSVKYVNFEIDRVNELIVWEADGIVYNSTMRQIGDILRVIFQNVLVQLSLSIAFECFQSYTKNVVHRRISSITFVLPSVSVLIPNTSDILNIISVLITLCPLCIMLSLNIHRMLKEIIETACKYIEDIVKYYGIDALIITVWNYVEIPLVFRLFWTMRVIEQFLYLSASTEMANKTLYDIIKYLLTNGCNTFISLTGMISCISYLCYHLEQFIQQVVLSNNAVNKYIEVVFTIIFYILALVTKLTSLESDMRFIQLYQNFFIVSAMLLNYIHSGVSVLFMSLNVPHNKCGIRAVLVCGFLLLVSVTMLTCLWYNHSLSPWLFIVSALNIQTITRVLVSFVIYTLLVNDFHSVSGSLNLDDNLYNIQTIGSVIDIGLNTLIFLTGIYIRCSNIITGMSLTFVLFIYSYSSIWCRSRKEWRTFMKRQTAVDKIELLSDATSEQLAEYNSFCIICYQNMDSAKATSCNHYFHSACLLKWFCIKDTCPMCLRVLFNLE